MSQSHGYAANQEHELFALVGKSSFANVLLSSKRTSVRFFALNFESLHLIPRSASGPA